MKGKNLPYRESPSQTAGPYVHIGLTPSVCGVSGVYEHDLGSQMRNDDTPGQPITIKGRLIDGDGEPLKDGLIEIWQADANGIYASPVDARWKGETGFAGWGRAACDFDSGEYVFETIRPGPVQLEGEAFQAPHINFWIVARGINIGLNTRMYFAGEPLNETDPVLQLVEPHRRETLIASEQSGVYHFDIHVQGGNETVFFDI